MKKISIALLAIVFAILAGCAQPAVRTIAQGTPITEEMVSSIKEGVTTKQELLSLLGKPMVATRVQDGSEVLIWQYTETKQYGATENKVFYGSRRAITSDTTMLNVTFDKNGIVKTFVKSDGSYGQQPTTITTEPLQKQ